MNPDTNKLERLKELFIREIKQLLRPNGEPVPKHWSIYKVGELVKVKDYTFKVAHIGESHLLLEPVGIPVIGENNE